MKPLMKFQELEVYNHHWFKHILELEILNRIDQLEEELEIKDDLIPQAPTRCRCEI